MCTGFRRGNINQRANLTDLGLGVLLKFKWFLGGQDGVACTGLICIRTQARGGPFQTQRCTFRLHKPRQISSLSKGMHKPRVPSRLGDKFFLR
jgi:hypothetical protein